MTAVVAQDRVPTAEGVTKNAQHSDTQAVPVSAEAHGQVVEPEAVLEIAVAGL